MAFSDDLREAMGDMTQEQLEERSGVDQSSISKLLLGKTEPSFPTLVKLERALPNLHDIRARALKNAS